tara:strand:- start:1885 stop:2049 length:165 start_codon:yes stop_codon:yes gene_type:complete
MAKNDRDNWRQVRVPTDLVDEVLELIESKKYKKMGFTSVSNLVVYLLRREIDRY